MLLGAAGAGIIDTDELFKSAFYVTSTVKRKILFARSVARIPRAFQDENLGLFGISFRFEIEFKKYISISTFEKYREAINKYFIFTGTFN